MRYATENANAKLLDDLIRQNIKLIIHVSINTHKI